MELIEQAVTEVRAGRPVVLPTDTVYGLATTPYRDEPTWRVYRLKGRPEAMPSALVTAGIDMLFECVPELRGRGGVIARALLPGPFTLILPNPARRFRWLTGTRPDTIGVRVPALEGIAREILERAGAVMATSANLHGGPDAKRVDEIPEEIRGGCAVVVDAGELLGVPSTVIDFTGPEPQVLREGAAPAGEAIERALAAVG